jgi:RNA polymerase sigma factor (TIGR02999 family)
MPGTRPPEVTQVLSALRAGDGGAAERLMELVYDQLRAMAGRFFRRQPPGHTLQPTALVHETFARLLDEARVDFKDRAHFLAVCAVAMRGILADHARRKRAAKRGGDWKRVDLSNVVTPSVQDRIDVLALDEALGKLARLSERQARIVECRFFSGMTIPEVAEALGLSTTTIEDDWRMARAWLAAQLAEGEQP